MVSALAYALYIVVVNRSKIVMSSVKLTFYAMLVCLLCIGLFSLIDRQPLTLLQSPTEWIYAALLGLVPTVVSLVYMAKAIHLIGSTPTAIMGALEPVTAQEKADAMMMKDRCFISCLFSMCVQMVFQGKYY